MLVLPIRYEHDFAVGDALQMFHDADGTRNPAVVDVLVVDLFHELLSQAYAFEPDSPTPVELFLHSSPLP